MSLSQLRGITLWQPWATLLALNLKGPETRGWQTHFRGELLIHAGTSREGLKIAAQIPEIVEALAAHRLRLDTLPMGRILAKAPLLNCLRIVPPGTLATPGIDLDPDTLTPLQRASGDYTTGRFAWMLGEATPTPPVPVKGTQGLWYPDIDTLKALGLI